MQNNTALLNTRIRSEDLTNMHDIPIWCARDTPLRSLYRLYEAMAARKGVVMAPEILYFWYQSRPSWALDQIPDPKDNNDPVRYAILACIVEELVEAFNWRLSIGMRRNGEHVYRENVGDPYPPYVPVKGPAWTERVPAVNAEWIADLPSEYLDASGRLVLEEDGLSPRFARRNIIASTGWFYRI